MSLVLSERSECGCLVCDSGLLPSEEAPSSIVCLQLKEALKLWTHCRSLAAQALSSSAFAAFPVWLLMPCQIKAELPLLGSGKVAPSPLTGLL